MHKDDQMTPKERAKALREGRQADRLQAVPFLTSVGPKIAGMTMREVRNDARKEAEFQITCYNLLGHDSAGVDYGLHGIGIALGSKADDPENAVPALTDYALKSLDDIHTLDIEKVTREHDPILARHYEAEKIILDTLGDEIGGVDFSLCGPMTAAASIFPTSQLLRAVRKNPGKVHELLRFSTEAIKLISRDFFQLGAGFTLCDPVASGTILRKDDYMEFVYPYTVELVNYYHEHGASVTYHICGNTNKIIEAMTDTGTDILSIDNIIDLKATKERVGGKVCIAGNVPPVQVMLEGSTDDVDASVRACFESAWDSPKGYILATGCGIPNPAPAENVFQFMASARKYGRVAQKN